MLISSFIDDEISSDEKVELCAHLKRCSSCRQRQEHFELVDRALFGVIGDSSQERIVAQSRLCATTKPEAKIVPADRIRWKRNLAAIITLAGAAVIAFLMVNLNVVENDGPKMSVDLTTPVVRLTEINSQRLHDQELLRESLELDLRTLKLQTLYLDDARAEKILDRIELLLKRIKQAKILENETYWEL